MENLTEHEKEILQLVCEGLTNQEIGAKLEFSKNTAKTHLSNIFKKIGVNGKVQAAIWAIKNGIV